jgi:hypothetical protein
MLVQSQFPQLFSYGAVEAVQVAGAIPKKQRRLFGDIADGDPRPHFGLNSRGPMHTAGGHVQRVDVAALAPAKTLPRYTAGWERRFTESGKAKAHFSASLGTSSAFKPASLES